MPSVGAWAVRQLVGLNSRFKKCVNAIFVPFCDFAFQVCDLAFQVGLAPVGFQPAGPYLTATPNTRYSFHVCIADRSPSDLFGRKQRLRTLLPPDESDGERSLCELFALVADRCGPAG